MRNQNHWPVLSDWLPLKRYSDGLSFPVVLNLVALDDALINAAMVSYANLTEIRLTSARVVQQKMSDS